MPILPSAVVREDCKVVTLPDSEVIEFPCATVVVSSAVIAVEFPEMFELAVFISDCSVVMADALLAMRGSARPTHAVPLQ